MKLKHLYLILILILTINCASSENSQKNDDVIKLIDLFIKENKIPKKNIVIVRISSYPQETDYLTVLYDFNPIMSVGKNEFDKDFGQYKYKEYKLSFVAENGIDISKILKNSNLLKFSETSFINENGYSWNYDPKTMSFFVDKNFNYSKPFQNGINEIEFDRKTKEYLKEK